MDRLLGVPAGLIERYGVISAECALAMARGAAGVTGAAWGIGTTGVAGPDGGGDVILVPPRPSQTATAITATPTPSA